MTLSTRLGSLGRTSQALAAVAAALDCQAADTRFLRVFHDLEASRAALHAELAKPLPEFGTVSPERCPYGGSMPSACCLPAGHPLPHKRASSMERESREPGYLPEDCIGATQIRIAPAILTKDPEA